MDDETPGRSIRPHKKTKTGCKTCRRRRIKCDESTPLCMNCDKREIECVWGDERDELERPPPRAKRLATPPVDSSSYKRAKSKHSQPSQTDSRPRTPPIEVSSPLSTTICSFPSMSAAANQPLDLGTLEMMHHYSTVLAYTFNDYDAPVSEFWKSGVPSLAFSTDAHFLLHAMLAVSALHLSYAHPEGALSTRYGFAARTQLDKAKASLIPILYDADSRPSEPDNMGITFITHFLIALYHFASSKNPLEPEWVRFLRTHVNMPMMEKFWMQYYHGAIGPFIRVLTASHEVIHKGLQHDMDERSDYQPPAYLQNIHLASCAPDPEEVMDPEISRVYAEAAGTLRRSWKASLHPGFEYQAALVWFVLIPDEFITLLSLKRPRALIIASHWCAIMLNMSTLRPMPWWMPNIWRTEIDRLRGLVGAQWEAWIPDYNGAPLELSRAYDVAGWTNNTFDQALYEPTSAPTSIGSSLLPR